MFLILTKYGGFYLCNSYLREPKSRWLVLSDAYYIKKKSKIVKYVHVSLENKNVVLIEKKGFRINEDEPWKTYNRVIAFIKGKKFHIKIKKELTEWRLE